jgi:hypothetical protein
VPEGALPVLGVDYALARRESIWYQTVAGLNHQFPGRSSLTLDYTFGYFDFRAQRDPDLWSHHAAVGYGYALGRRRTTLRVTYRYDQGMYGFVEHPALIRNHNLEAAVDYRRSVSRTRQFWLAFGSGASYVGMPNPAIQGPDWYRQVSAFGQAGIDIGRSWLVAGEYRRGFQFVPGWAQPYYADTAGVNLAGYLGRRVDVSLSGYYSNGEVGFTGVRGYATALGSSQLRVALTKNLAAFANYLYYSYQYDRNAPLPTGYARTFDRQGIRVGLTLWCPLLRGGK